MRDQFTSSSGKIEIFNCRIFRRAFTLHTVHSQKYLYLHCTCDYFLLETAGTYTDTHTHLHADPDRDRDPAHCQVPTGIRLASDAPAKEKTANRPQRRKEEAEEKQKKWKMWRKKEWKILNCPHVYYRVRLTHIICSILIQSISSLCCVCTLHTIDQRLTLIRHSSSFQLQSFETHWNAMHDSASLYTAISIIHRSMSDKEE